MAINRMERVMKPALAGSFEYYNKYDAHSILRKEFPEKIAALGIHVDELSHFDRVLSGNICHPITLFD